MKKIKPVLNKTKIKGLPKIGLFLHAHLRHKLAHLTARWYKKMRQEVEEEVELHLFLSGVKDTELDLVASSSDFTRIHVTAGAAFGSRLNEGLTQLKSHGLDAVIPVANGDFIGKNIILAYAQHLKKGGLFSGLLDQYFYDPNELKCIHWARGEAKEGLERTCEIAMLLSANMLEHLKWQLWPSQSNRGLDALHEGVMTRLSKVFSFAPPKTCLLQTMASYGGQVFVFKSELGRALFDESNWQRSMGQSIVDFEEVFEPVLGEEWIENIDDFDERINLDIIIEAPSTEAAHLDLWKDHYEFLPFKFDPYAQVRLKVIPNEDNSLLGLQGLWQPVKISETDSRGDRWSKAVHESLNGNADFVLFGGKGSIVDLKTIEHFLIFATKEGAKLLSVSNFFLAFDDGHQGHFWPGKESLGLSRSLGFGSCVHRDYLKQLGENIFEDDGQLSSHAQESFMNILGETDTKHQRILFQLVRHQLGLISFEIDGAFGFSDLIRLSDLKAVTISEHLHISTLRQTQRTQLVAWEQGEESKSHNINQHLTLQSDDNKMTSDPTQSSGMSALERAKALLNQSKTTAAAETSTNKQESEAPVSALDRAKALLNQSPPASSSEKTADHTDQEKPMSALDRAKALLKGSQIEETESKQSDASETAEQVESSEQSSQPVSALEKAKKLLQTSQNASAKVVESTVEEATDTTQAILDQAMRGAEAMIGQLKATADAAKAMVEKEKDNLNNLADETGSESPAHLLCERGEIAFEGGDAEQAATLFDSALLLDPSSVRALNNLGVMALHNDDPWKALSHFLMGVIQDPENEDLMINLQGLFDFYPELKTVRSVVFE